MRPTHTIQFWKQIHVAEFIGNALLNLFYDAPDSVHGQCGLAAHQPALLEKLHERAFHLVFSEILVFSQISCTSILVPRQHPPLGARSRKSL